MELEAGRDKSKRTEHLPKDARPVAEVEYVHELVEASVVGLPEAAGLAAVHMEQEAVRKERAALGDERTEDTHRADQG